MARAQQLAIIYFLIHFLIIPFLQSAGAPAVDNVPVGELEALKAAICLADQPQFPFESIFDGVKQGHPELTEQLLEMLAEKIPQKLAEQEVALIDVPGVLMEKINIFTVSTSVKIRMMNANPALHYANEAWAEADKLLRKISPTTTLISIATLIFYRAYFREMHKQILNDIVNNSYNARALHRISSLVAELLTKLERTLFVKLLGISHKSLLLFALQISIRLNKVIKDEKEAADEMHDMLEELIFYLEANKLPIGETMLAAIYKSNISYHKVVACIKHRLIKHWLPKSKENLPSRNILIEHLHAAEKELGSQQVRDLLKRFDSEKAANEKKAKKAKREKAEAETLLFFARFFTRLLNEKKAFKLDDDVDKNYYGSVSEEIFRLVIRIMELGKFAGNEVKEFVDSPLQQEKSPVQQEKRPAEEILDRKQSKRHRG